MLKSSSIWRMFKLKLVYQCLLLSYVHGPCFHPFTTCFHWDGLADNYTLTFKVLKINKIKMNRLHHLGQILRQVTL